MKPKCMTRLEREVDEFFDKYGDIYDAPFDVQVIWLHGNGVLIAAPWERTNAEDESELTVSFESDDYKAFTEAFGIKGNVVEAINRIRPEDVMKLYLKGKAFIDCTVGDGQLLSFQKIPGGRTQVEDVYETKHEIIGLLEQPEQFISYTRQYYKIDRYIKEYVSLKIFNTKEKCFVIN